MYTFESVVRYSECDEHSRLTIPALINYLQDASTFHSEEIGHGVRYLKEHHFFWAITSWQIKISRLPSFCEPIRVSTWCYDVGAVSAQRNFMVETQDGERLVEADSMWVVFDTDKGRAVRIPASEIAFLTEDAPLDLPHVRRKLNPIGEGTALDPIVVSKHHLDTNHHVNNGQYIQMSADVVATADPDFRFSGLLVQYRNQAAEHDVIVPHLYREEDAYCIDLTNEDGTRYAICRMYGSH